MRKFTTQLANVTATIVGPITTDADRLELRADTDFTDGTVALLKYPSQVVAFYGQEPPRMQLIPAGVYLAKGEAGDFRMVPADLGDALLAAAGVSE